ncbi:hypothetical protein A2V68_00455 [candidate division Kazan bacterium RBG_13_50_9]|uniref:Nudix hydrolase domain-containing protein n=1 Tax=candidate division Kazan bacterium RBG_13_50_9 TaxID=1798535 RepID=A0A1F4NS81_UNCK3|nr:MAG: hypothetical protein A2V68_00455 [candidate division Kazan bacterium RBG_13_50_9]
MISLLEVGDKRGFIITPDRAGGITIENSFFDVRVGVRQSAQPGGGIETWVDLRSRPAAEVAPIRVNPDGEVEVVLMRKQYRADQVPFYKVPGGYILSENPDFDLRRKIAADTGILIKDTVIYLGSTAGHPEIVTPIGLFAAPTWEKVAPPREGIELVHMRLETALSFFDQHALGSTYGLPDVAGARLAGAPGSEPLFRIEGLEGIPGNQYQVNSTGFELLFRLERRLRSGELQLPIPGYSP